MGQFGIGQAVRRTEDRRLLTGHGRYIDDIALPNQCHAAFVRAPFAHARIARIDAAAARAVDGVLAVYAHDDIAADKLGTIPCFIDIENRDGSAMAKPARPALADGVVRHVGDPVCMVVAETVASAREAAELVDVEYEELPAVVDTARALDADAARVWDAAAGNLCFDWETGDEAAVARAFETAAHVTELSLINSRIIPNAMEPRGAVGDHDAEGERYVLYTPSQGSHGLKNQLSQNIFDVAKDRVRVVTPDVGGGFGMKIFLYPEQVMVTWAASKLHRPVKWISDRGEAFLTDNHGRDHVTEAAMAFDDDGRITGVRVATIANLGAYLSNFAPYIPTKAGAAMLCGVYRTPAVHLRVQGVFTNTAPIDAYRGAGRPEANYIVERLLDAAAAELGIGPEELRRRNFIAPDEMPYRTALDLTYDSGEFDRNLSDALDRAGWADREDRRTEAAARGALFGMGLATYVESCGGMPDERAEIRVDPDGTITLLIGTQSNGQGHETAYAQIIADRLDLPLGSVRVVQGDTDRVSYGRGTGGSRSLPVGGVATAKAAEIVLERAKRLAADALEAGEGDIEYEGGTFRIAGTDRTVDLFALAARADAAVEDGSPDNGLGAISLQEPSAPTFPNGCHVCAVEIEKETGAFRITRYTVVDDFGTVINPLLVEGQVHGGIAQGIGQAAIERCVYDGDSGQLLSGSFMDYGMPRAGDLPMIDFSYNEVPCTTNPLGLKGAGEAGTIGATPAMINAIVDALRPLGVRHVDMPVTQEGLWRLIRDAEA